jgi:hypothetical protein
MLDRTSWGQCGGFDWHKNSDSCSGRGRARSGGQTGDAVRVSGEGSEGARHTVSPSDPFVFQPPRNPVAGLGCPAFARGSGGRAPLACL